MIVIVDPKAYEDYHRALEEVSLVKHKEKKEEGGAKLLSMDEIRVIDKFIQAKRALLLSMRKPSTKDRSKLYEMLDKTRAKNSKVMGR